ncbi:MAG TPA: cyanophycinase, partial [Rectinemataceae bacterium]|nr:cyanophycinase [Rectinemataceae bacterium]
MSRGDLVIVGGAEVLHRAPIVRRFVELAGGCSSRYLILASGTGRPIPEFEKMRRWLAEAGVEASRVELLRVSSFLEGGAEGARAPEELAKLQRADAVWMLGGDQNLTLGLLREADGRDTPLLAALRDRVARPRTEGGLVLGGTSAGAAVMSDPMIGGGTSFGALALPRAAGAGRSELSDSLYITGGFGFFDAGIIDQHFDTRARFGRLLEAALVED